MAGLAFPDDDGERVHALGRCVTRAVVGSADAEGRAPTVWTYDVYAPSGERLDVSKRRDAHTDQRDGPVPGQWLFVSYRPEDPDGTAWILHDRAEANVARLVENSYEAAGRVAPAVVVPEVVRAEYEVALADHEVAQGGARGPMAWLLLSLLLATVVGAVYVIVTGVFGSADDRPAELTATRTPIGEARVARIEAGDWTLWIADGSAFARSNEPEDYGVSVSVRPVGGDPLALDPYGGSASVRSGGITRLAWYTLTVPRTGDYEIAASGGNGDAEYVVIGAGSRVGRVLFSVFGGIGILFGGIAIVGTLAWLHGRRRRPKDASVLVPDG